MSLKRLENNRKLLDEIVRFANQNDPFLWPKSLARISRLASANGYSYFFFEKTWHGISWDEIPKDVNGMPKDVDESEYYLKTHEAINVMFRDMARSSTKHFERPVAAMHYVAGENPAIKVSFSGKSKHDLCDVAVLLMFILGVKVVRECPMCNEIIVITKRDKKTCSPRCRKRLQTSKMSEEEKEALKKKRVEDYKQKVVNGGKK